MKKLKKFLLEDWPEPKYIKYFRHSLIMLMIAMVILISFSYKISMPYRISILVLITLQSILILLYILQSYYIDLKNKRLLSWCAIKNRGFYEWTDNLTDLRIREIKKQTRKISLIRFIYFLIYPTLPLILLTFFQLLSYEIKCITIILFLTLGFICATTIKKIQQKCKYPKEYVVKIRNLGYSNPLSVTKGYCYILQFISWLLFIYYCFNHNFTNINSFVTDFFKILLIK